MYRVLYIYSLVIMYVQSYIMYVQSLRKSQKDGVPLQKIMAGFASKEAIPECH